MEKRKKIGFVLGFFCFIFFMVAPPPNGMNPLGMKALAISSLMAILWVTEAISIFATSFLPIALFPLLGILIPFILWTSKKGKIKNSDKLGKDLINFEITWTILLFFIPLVFLCF